MTNEIPQLPIWLDGGIEPPPTLKEGGWRAATKPPAQYMNWFMNRTYRALEYLINNSGNNEDVGDIAELETEDKTNIVHAVNEVNEKVTSHLEQNAVEKHKANQISFVPPTGMTATNVQTALQEVFQAGNNVKADMVAALLALDSSLPISNSSTWDEIESVVALLGTAKIETFNVTVSASQLSFTYLNGNTATANYVSITSIGFTPKSAIAVGVTSATEFVTCVSKAKLSIYDGYSARRSNYSVGLQTGLNTFNYKCDVGNASFSDSNIVIPIAPELAGQLIEVTVMGW